MKKKILGTLLSGLLLANLLSITAFADTYVVKKGDTLWDIGKKYSVSWKSIAQDNKITVPKNLQIGTVLTIDNAEKTVQPVQTVTQEVPKETEKPEAIVLYTETVVSIKNDGHTIPGILTMPVGEGKFPAVVMMHGTGSDKNEAGGGYALCAPELAKAGIASLRFDFVGSGYSTASYTEYSFSNATSDANAVAAYLKTLAKIDGTRIGVMGWSQGGTNALIAAGHNRNFQSVLTWAGAPDLSILNEDSAYEEAKAKGFFVREFAWRTPLSVGLKWFEEVRATNVLDVFSNTNSPVLAINGSLDDVVIPENAAKIVAASSNPLSKVMLIDGADHTFNIFTGDMAAFNKLINATVEWFSDTLKPQYVEENIVVMNGERKVFATVTIPVGKGLFATAVINHGHGGSRHENIGFDGLAERLAEQKILSIRMDFPGCGDSEEPFTENYMSNMISDSNVCLEYVIKNYPVNKDKLGIVGYSMGGRVALEIVSTNDNPYKATALLAPSADPGKEMALRMLGSQKAYDEFYAEANKNGFALFTTQWGQEQKLSIKWFDEMEASVPLKNITAYNGTMLVVYGDKDNVVTEDINKLVLAAYPKAQSVVVSLADHGYGFYSDQPTVSKAVEDSITLFLEKSLK